MLVSLLAACGADPESEAVDVAGIVRDPAPQVGRVSLPDVSSGTERALSASPDHLLVVYFGFTSCPDVCPTTLSDLSRALDELGPAAEQIEVAVATIDPGRDTPERLVDYAHTFVPNAWALRTDDEDRLSEVAQSFGVSYEVRANDQGQVEVDHTGFLYAVDDQGQLRLTWPFGISAEAIAGDLAWLLEEA